MERFRKKRETEEGDGIFRKLPDEVLSHILSFLPSTEAGRTCVLSKRWRHVWKIVPALEFQWFPSEDTAKEANMKMKLKGNEFLRLRRTKKITRLHLECNVHSSLFLSPGYPSCNNYVEGWVDEAVTGKVEHVNLRFEECRWWVSLPMRLLTCTTIVTMKIEGSFILTVPTRIHLPSLKNLHLNLRKCQPSCKNFLSGSPALEVLYLKEEDNSSLVLPRFPNLVQLELHLTKDAVSLPITLFTCATIMTMKIEGPSTNLSLPSSIKLPSLKNLHLNVRKCELASCKEFLSRTPALEVFYLNEGDHPLFKEFKIKRNSRGNLIVSCNPENHHDYDYVYMALHNQDSSQAFPYFKAIQNVEFLCDRNKRRMKENYSSLDFSNLVHLELHLRKDMVSLPMKLFACATIVTMKIEGPSINLSVPSCINLPSLKSLHLNVRNCEASCKEFLSGSPVLEVFNLKQKGHDESDQELRIERNSRGNLIVSNNQLLNLVIQSDCAHDYVHDYLEGDLESIVKAKVSMTLNPEKNWKRSIIYKAYLHAFSILNAIRNVELLSLRDMNESMEGDSSVDLPKLPNLVQLQLRLRDWNHSRFLKLLSGEYCPKLEEYGVNNMHWKYCKQQKKWINTTTTGMHPHHSGHLS